MKKREQKEATIIQWSKAFRKLFIIREAFLESFIENNQETSPSKTFEKFCLQTNNNQRN